MAFDGNGNFNRVFNWVSDRDNSIAITASRMDTEMDGFATGLSTCITKDGQTVITANIPMSNFKFTGMAEGTTDGDSVRFQQVLRTTGANVKTTGSVTFNDNVTVRLGTAGDLTMSHDGLGTVFQNATGNWTFDQQSDGSPIIILADTGAGVSHTVAELDAVNCQFRHNNVVALATDTNGIIVGDAAGDNPQITFYQDDGSTQNALIQANAAIASGLEIENLINGGIISMYSPTLLGARQALQVWDPENGVSIYDTAGNVGFFMNNLGPNIQETAGGSTEVSFWDAAGTTRRATISSTANGVTIQNRVAAGAVNLIGTNVNIQAQSDNNPILRFFQDDGSVLNGFIEFNSTAGVAINNQQNGTPVIIRGNDNGGVLREGIRVDFNAEVRLYYQSTEQARTETTANGGFAIANGATGSGGLERAVTVSDVPACIHKTANTSRASNTTATDDPDLTYAIPRVGVYHFECEVFFQKDNGGVAGGSFKFGLNYTGTLGASGTLVYREYFAGATALLAPNQQDVVGQSAITSGSTVSSNTETAGQPRAIHMKGVLDVTSTGTLSLQWAQNVSSTNATVVRGGSFFRVQRCIVT